LLDSIINYWIYNFLHVIMDNKRIVLFFLLAISSLTLFADDSAVVKLTVNNFQGTVLDSE
jgi:hypothetical protein